MSRKNFLKMASALLLGSIALAAISIILLITLMNPNEFQKTISHQISKETGQKFTIHGAITWSFWPFVAIKIQNAQFTKENTQKKQEPFITIDELTTRIKLLPLIQHRIKITDIFLTKPCLKIMLHDDSHPLLWSTLRKKLKKDLIPTINTSHFKLHSLNIKNGCLIIKNKHKKIITLFDSINLTGNNLQSQRFFYLKASAIQKYLLSQNEIALHLTTKLGLTKDKKELQAPNLHFHLVLKKWHNQDVLQIPPISLQIITALKVNLKSLDASMENIQVHTLGGMGEGSLHLKSLKSPLKELSGKIQFDFPNPQTSLSLLPFKLEGAFFKSLNQLKGSFDFNTRKNHLNFPAFTLKVNNANVSGSSVMLHVNKSWHTKAKLTVDKLDLDHYLSPQLLADKEHFDHYLKNLTHAMKKIPLFFNASITIKKLIARKMIGEHIQANINSPLHHPQTVFITTNNKQKKIKASLMITIPPKDRPIYKLTTAFQEINMKNLLANFSKIPPFIQGNSSFELDLTSYGDTKYKLIKNLKGKGSINIKNGQLKGIDATAILSQAMTLIHHKKYSLPSLSSDLKKTSFDKLKGSFTIKHGVIYNDDLLLLSSTWEGKGSGKVDLNLQNIHYTVRFAGVKNTTVNNNQEKVSIHSWSVPVNISSNIMHPNIKPNFFFIEEMFLKNIFKKNKKKSDTHLKKSIPNHQNHKASS